MKKNWLVRMKNVIHGPMDQEELERMLRDKKLSPKDEVNKPLMWWVPVKNCKNLMEIYNRSKPLLEETTGSHKLSKNAAKADSGDQTQQTKLSPSGEPLSAQRIQDDSFKDLNEPDLKSVQDVEFDSSEEETLKRISPEKEVFESVDHTRTKARKKAGNIIHIVWILCSALILVSVLYFVFPDRFFKINRLNSGQTLTQARQAFQFGYYEKSLSLFRDLSLQTAGDRITKASLIVQLENDAYTAQRILESAQTQDEDELERMMLIEGMIQYKNNNMENAGNIFNQARLEMKDPSLAFLNQAVMKIKNKDTSSALADLSEILSLENKDQSIVHTVLFLQALFHESLLAGEPPVLQLESAESAGAVSDSEDQDAEKIVETADSISSKEILQNLAERKKDYSQEASFLLLYRFFMVQEPEDESLMVSQIQNFLNQDPYLTRDHRRDILSYSPLKVWRGHLMEKCSFIFNQSPENSYFIALYSFCQLQSGLVSEALSGIEKAVSQTPKSPLIQAVYGYALMENRLIDQSILPIELSIQYNQKWVLPFILQAKVCEKNQDFECSKKYWEKVESHSALSALAGLSLVWYRLDRKELSYEKIKQGLKLSPYHRVFLQLGSLFE